MLSKLTLAALAALIAASPLGHSQQKVGSNAYVDLYFGDWHTSQPHPRHGSLMERDILTKGDALHPTTKGAVLHHLDSYTYATLAEGATTGATKLGDKQEIYFFLSGSGTITAGNTKGSASTSQRRRAGSAARGRLRSTAATTTASRATTPTIASPWTRRSSASRLRSATRRKAW